MRQTREEPRPLAEISQEISDFYARTAGRISSNFGRKSVRWSQPEDLTFAEMILNRPLKEAIHYVQSQPTIYLSDRKGKVWAGLCGEDLVDDLRSQGYDLDQAPPEIRESELTAPEQIIGYNGRPVSVDFLYRLNVCQRFRDVLAGDNPLILEIGAGLGALARTVKLLCPGARYIIIDLLDTLVVSYGFLRSNFPHSSATLIGDSEQLRDLDTDVEFTFIPAELVPLRDTGREVGDRDLSRLQIDLALNTQSLGEMRQDIAESYIDLIQNRLNVKRFYSLNKFLHHEEFALWRDETFSASYTAPLDAYWDVLRWEFCPGFVAHTRWGDENDTLELYVQRTASVDADTLLKRSNDMLAEAQKMGNFRGRRWHRLMWDSIRLCPRRENVEPYYHLLKASERRQSRYFGRILAGYGVQVDQPFTLSTAYANEPFFKRPPRHAAAAVLGRIAEPIARLLGFQAILRQVK